jgi:tRNA(fMet)-specific endonuclease VapC
MSDSRASEGLLDTSVVVLLPRIVSPDFLPEVPLISTITLAELSVGPLATDDTQIRAARLAHLQQAEADFEPLPFDAAAARAFGRVASLLLQRGKKPAARAYDALIAATAISNRIPLYTCNPKDFEGIDNLKVVAVPHPDHGGTS